MFASDLGELFSGVVGAGTGNHSTGVVTLNNTEISRNTAGATQTVTDTNPAGHGSSISTHLSKTTPSSTSTAALEHLFSSEYDLSIKSIVTSQNSSNPGVNVKLQSQHRPISSTYALDPAATAAKQSGVSSFSHIRGSLRCPVCDKAFSNSSAIAKHKLTHSEERKYVCGICHKAFKRQDHLNGHKYTHESKKPHACHFCDKSYSDARSLRRHYENAHPEEYNRWLVLSQATNGDTSAIAVAAAAALFSTGLENVSTDQGGNSVSSGSQEISVDPSTTALLSSVFNSPVRGVLGRAAAAAAAAAGGFSVATSTDVLKPTRSGSASPASSSAINDNQGCSLSTATSPTGLIDPLDREDDEPHETPSVVSITAEDMATAAKVALMMAHPLEAPKRVACAVCQKRFKNQSALNGHMRLHGGYGPAGIAVSNSGNSSTTSNATIKSAGSDDRSRVHDKTTVIDQSAVAPGSKRQNSVETNFQSSNLLLDSAHSPAVHCDESSHSLIDFVSLRSSREGSLWCPESQIRDLQREPSSSRSSIHETSSATWHQQGDFARLVNNPSADGDRRSMERLTNEVEFHPSSVSQPGKSHRQSQYPAALSYHLPRSASASTVSSMAACCTRSSRPMQSESCWSTRMMDNTDEWQKPDTSRSPNAQMNSNSFNKGSVLETSSGIGWWPGPQQLWNSDSRRPDNSGWTNACSKVEAPVNITTATPNSRQPQFLDLDTKVLSNRSWNSNDNRPLPYDEKTSLRRRCNPSLNLDLSDVSSIERPLRIGGSHSSGMTSCPSSHPGSQPRDVLAFRSQLVIQQGQPPPPPSQCAGPFTMANQYSPVTPAPNSASIMVDQHMEQPMAFQFPPTSEAFQSVGGITDSVSYPTDPHMPPRVTGGHYCTSPPARLTSGLERSTVEAGGKGLDARAGLRHSSSSGKLAPLLLNRWQPGQVDSNRPISAHASSGYLNQTAHQQTPHHYDQGGQHAHQQQFANILDNPTQQTYRLNESWSSHNPASSSHGMEQVSSGPAHLPPSSHSRTANQHSNGSFSLGPPIDPADIPCFSRQRYPSDHQIQGSKPMEEHPAFVQPYPHSFNHHPNQRTAFNDECRDTIRIQTAYPTCTEASSSFGAETLFHSFGDSNTTLLHDQNRQPVGEPEPERTRHTSAPILRPDDRSDPSASLIRVSDGTCSRGYSGGAFFAEDHAHTRSQSPNNAGLERKVDCGGSDAGRLVITSPHSHPNSHQCHLNQGNEFATSDTVADLLMQSHITDPFTMPEKLARCTMVANEAVDTFIGTPTSDVPHLNRSGPVTSVVSSASGSNQELSFPDTSVIMSEAQPSLTLAPHGLTAKSRSDTAQANAGSSSADESDQSAVARLSKSMAEDNLFRNPHTLPPPKKLKRKPAPIFIPPQTGANLSRLRSPRVWGSDGSTISSSPLPYTPPPMLSPNRRGSGLFSSLSRWPSTASPVVTTRRYSSYYPFSVTGSTGDSGRRKPPNLPPLSFGPDSDGGHLLKRTYTSRMMMDAVMDVSTTATTMSTAVTGDTPMSSLGPSQARGFSTDCQVRQFAFPKRRYQLTPKSAPVLLQETTTSVFQNVNQNTFADEVRPEGLPVVSSGTIFGYDDETMRRIAEADAADRARRMRRSRRRCDTEHLLLGPAGSNRPIQQTKPEVDEDSLMHMDQETELETVDDLMNCKPQVELEVVEDTLAVLDEEMHDQAEYAAEEDEDDVDEEGLPSSLIPRINIGDAFQAEIPEFTSESMVCSPTDTENRERLLWDPEFINETDPKNIDSLNLLMKLACSPAVRNCGLNMEYAFHLLCKYEGNVEKALHALLHDTLVVYDYVYAETALWTTEEIARFQFGLTVYGRDFHLVARDLQASGMNKTVKACVEFYYVWKRMNTPTDVKWYREKARRQRLTNNRAEGGPADDAPLVPFDTYDTMKDSAQPDLDAARVSAASSSSTYNLRRKPHPTTSTTTQWRDRSTVLSTVPEQTSDSQPLHSGDISALDTTCNFNFASMITDSTPIEDGVTDDLVSSYSTDPMTEARYPCRFCNRVFTKVKSRNAHMKSHSDRSSGSVGSAINRPLPQTTTC